MVKSVCWIIVIFLFRIKAILADELHLLPQQIGVVLQIIPCASATKAQCSKIEFSVLLPISRGPRSRKIQQSSAPIRLVQNDIVIYFRTAGE